MTGLHHATPASQSQALDLLLYLAEAVPTAESGRSLHAPRTEHRYQHSSPRHFPDNARHYPERRYQAGQRRHLGVRDHDYDWSRPLPAADLPRARALKVIIVSAVFVVLAVTIAITARLSVSTVIIAYWTFNAIEIVFCLLTYANSRGYRDLPIASGRVLAIVPAYNEPTDKLHACVRSLLAQTVPLDRIVVVDDGSAEPVIPFYHPRVDWVRQANRGKRGAHATALRGFRAADVDFVLTVDSDSTPRPDALEHLLRAMSDQSIQAVTGWIWVRNYDESLIARAADVNIGASCVMMRSSRSALGALETTSGALALYRGPVLYDNLADYEVECGTGDDRWLTMRALTRGRVIGVNAAIVETDMPSDIRGTFNQRLRWARSWWWMLPFVYRRLGWNAIISPTIGLIQALSAPFLYVWALASWTFGFHHQLAHIWVTLPYVMSFIVVKYALAVLYLSGRPDMPFGEKAKSLLIGTPVATLMSMLLLLPLRYYALTKLHDKSWRNRQVKEAS